MTFRPRTTQFDPRRKAYWVFDRALRSGRIERPSECSRCATVCIPHGHHPDYSKPLEVVWLCQPCHVLVHQEMREPARAKIVSAITKYLPTEAA